MFYSFSQFKLYPHAVDLFFNDELIPLTKQNFELLELLVKNPNKVFSKDDIIEELWNGRVVNENTVDKSISKLRKILNSYQKETYIKTVYAKGFKFALDVEIDEDEASPKKHSSPKKNKFILPAILISLVLFSSLFFKRNTQKEPNNTESPMVLIMPSENSGDEEWLNQSTDLLIKQVFNFSTNAQVKDFQDKPKFLEKQEFLNNQWRIAPQLKVVTTKIIKQGNSYIVEMEITDNQKASDVHTFKHKNLSSALKSASRWLTSEFSYKETPAQIDALLPKESYVVELYMHGLASYTQNKFDKSEHFLKLCLTEQADFVLARLQLAKVKFAQGDIDKTLALLDTIESKPVTAQIDINANNLRAMILDQQGKHQQAKESFLNTLEKYKGRDYPQLDGVRYDLSFTYKRLSEFEKALTVLNELESSIFESKNSELLADVLQNKASILQKIGETKQAEIEAKKSLKVFEKLKDLLGEAKIHTTIARIKTHQGKFNQSIMHLNKSLTICRSLDFKLGIGATINELIYILMTQGQFDQALELNKEMEEIAIEIDYQAMLQISKQFYMDINRLKGDLIKSEIYLQEHLKLAEEIDSKAALIKNKLLAVDLYLDQKKADKIPEILDDIQVHIDETGEKRLQPRINKKRAMYYVLTKQIDKAIELFQSAKQLAKNTDDGETLVEINNALIELYLGQEKYDKARELVNESSGFSPLPYPYLLLKSKLENKTGHKIDALQLANECKRYANQWWKLDDERYLHELQLSQ